MIARYYLFLPKYIFYLATLVGGEVFCLETLEPDKLKNTGHATRATMQPSDL